MDKREETLREALVKNAEECERWEQYKKENETAIENLKEFSKHLTVEVMVPIGLKCFMPGQLIHTNEVLVGHYQGYFSKCTAHKATEICSMRINRAKEQLQKLETEADFWTHKLEMPYVEGVIPTSEQQEIIEDYDEETEKRWREKHVLNVKLSKLQEKKVREAEDKQKELKNSSNAEKSDKDIFKMLEEAELMEELEKELENLKIDEVNDEILQKLMAGEMEPTKPKKRTAHELNTTKSSDTFKPKLDGIVRKNTSEFNDIKTSASNNNTRPNPVIDEEIIEATRERDFELTDEVKVIKEQAQFLPATDQVGFYEYLVEIVRKKINSLKMTSEENVEEKLHQLTVLEELEDLLALAEDEIIVSDNETESIKDETIDIIGEEKQEETTDKNKRRIKFALEDETLLFRKNEAVSQMLPKPKKSEKPKRDVIQLDSGDVYMNKTNLENCVLPVKKKESILDKVQKNLEYVANHQSQVDCDLITKIIDETDSKNRTIYITFKHSTNQPVLDVVNESNTLKHLTQKLVPEKPSDFYELYLKQQESNKIESKHLYINSYVGEDKVKAPILRESNRQECYEDPKALFSIPTSYNKSKTEKAKPILRNKAAVERETHFLMSNPNKPPSKKRKKVTDNEEEIMSAYNKVMNDVIEKPLTEPEPLPDVKFIDAHTPKKRVSRFKQTRKSNEKT